jgi:hypothetical protein
MDWLVGPVAGRLAPVLGYRTVLRPGVVLSPRPPCSPRT